MPSIYLSPSVQEFNTYLNGGTEEYYMNLIADAMEPYLTASGISYTRNRPDQTVAQIIQESNSGNYDLHLALHSNASPESLKGVLSGADFYYYTRSVNGRRAAATLADNYMNIYPEENKVRIMPTTTLGEVVRTRAPSVLAELAYHDNAEDEAWLKNNVDKIGRNLTQGVAEFLGVVFRDPSYQTAGKEGYVSTNGGNLNIRSAPSLYSDIIAKAPNGSKIITFGLYGDWYVVNYEGTLGFANSRYIRFAE